MIVYLNGQMIPKDEARISPEDRGFLFADGVYEVIRSYDGKLFRAAQHLERLRRSLREVRLDSAVAENLPSVIEELIRRNGLEKTSTLIYIQITRGVAKRKHAFPDNATPVTIYATAASFTPPRKEQEEGVRIILVPDMRWARCDIKSVALLPNVLACQQAEEQGCWEAAFVRDGVVTEGTHTNFCAVFGGTLWTHPMTNHILGGVTRDAVLELCGKLCIPVKEAPVFEWKLRDADEVLLTGTTAEVMPVVAVNDWKVGNGKPGPIAQNLLRAFTELTTS
jgi:D-alanine transaminase